MKLPEINKIGGQSSHSALRVKIFDVIDYLIRGYGVRNREIDFKKYSRLLNINGNFIRKSSRVFHDYLKHNTIFKMIKENKGFGEIFNEIR
ncbi:MAG: hypothetical protein PWP54_1514 [Thermosipho sp. (in: thermotogales)]|nr:hypothetical protein [Thermosipho sp. (in: thermotogales)]MDN5325259.1 hypothetical protein [Thermosipho sp. (in: thermotogales)]